MIKTDKLLHTDQTSCFNEAGNEVDCLDSGQDGAYGFMERSSEDRFRARYAIVEDTWTGLVWHRNANLAEFPLSWEEALQFVQEMNHRQHSGRSDWRLPKRAVFADQPSDHQSLHPRA